MKIERQILKKINEMLNNKNGLSDSEKNFLSGLKKYYRRAHNFSDKQIAVFDEIYNKYSKNGNN
jgi:hypothetical protein